MGLAHANSISIRTPSCPGCCTREVRCTFYFFFSLSAGLDGVTFTSSLRTSPLTGWVSVRASFAPAPPLHHRPLRHFDLFFRHGDPDILFLEGFPAHFRRLGFVRRNTLDDHVLFLDGNFQVLRFGADLLVNGDLAFLRTLPGFKLLLANGDAGFLFHAAAVSGGFLGPLAQTFTRFFHAGSGSFAHLRTRPVRSETPGIPGFACPLFLEVRAPLPDDHLILTDILDVVVGDQEILMEEPGRARP